MKKATKATPSKKAAKKITKKADSDELRKPAKLKPMKEKEKKNWKQSIEEDDDMDMLPDEDLKLDDLDAADEEDEYFDDNY